MLRPTDYVIDDYAPEALGRNIVINGEMKGRGYVERDFNLYPEAMFDPPSSMPLIPQGEWAERIRDKEGNQSCISHLCPWPSLDQNGQGYCIPAGSLIRMADGSQKPIERVTLLEKVLTAEGNVGAVEQCHVRHYEGDMIEVRAYGHSHFRCTPEHPVMTRRGYVRAGELTTDDWVCAPRYAPADCAVALTASHVSGTRRRVPQSGEAAEWQTKPAEYWHHNCNHVPDVIHLNKGVGRIFGLWLAEGCFDEGAVVWCFGTHETETLVAELRDLLEQEWGIEATVKQGPVPSVTLVEIHGKLWRQLFESLLGKGAGGKRMHSDLTRGPVEFLGGVFWGWMAGDGCTRNPNRKLGYSHEYKIGATVSHDLAMNMYDIACAIGLCPSIIREKPQKNRHAKVRRPVWKVQVNPNPSGYRTNYRMEAGDGRVWRKIRELTKSPHSGNVFNIGVEGDNSYVAEGLAVHNCWSYSTTGATMMLRSLMNQPYVRLSAHATAFMIKGGRDEGGWCGLSAERQKSHGTPSVEFWPEKSMSRSHDKPETWANAAMHKVTEDWIDLTASVYDRNLTFAQMSTCLLTNTPCALDFNWWSHSVAGADLVDGVNSFDAGLLRGRTSGKLMTLREFDSQWATDFTAGFAPRIRNSWTDSWGDRGFGVLAGSKGIPNGAVALRVTGASTT